MQDYKAGAKKDVYQATLSLVIRVEAHTFQQGSMCGHSLFQLDYKCLSVWAYDINISLLKEAGRQLLGMNGSYWVFSTNRNWGLQSLWQPCQHCNYLVVLVSKLVTLLLSGQAYAVYSK